MSKNSANPVDSPASPAGGFLVPRVVQVHPTLRCNLACAHCYSSSGPREKDELAPRDLIERLVHLRAEGYDVVSFSGGEPLVYRGFEEVAREARRLGFRVNLITNGLLLDDRRLDLLAQLVSVVGLSLDGKPERHDELRGRRGTFERMVSRLEGLRARDIPFGFAHCVTRPSIAELPWLLDFALEQGAALLQLHPLTLGGRAAELSTELRLRPTDLDRLFVLAELLRIQAGEALAVQLDLVTVRHALARRDRYVLTGETEDPEAPLAELINPMVLDQQGRFWPLSYGLSPSQCLTPGPRAGWRQALEARRHEGFAALGALLRQAFDELEELPADTRFVEWYEHLAEVDHRRANGGSIEPWRRKGLVALGARG